MPGRTRSLWQGRKSRCAGLGGLRDEPKIVTTFPDGTSLADVEFDAEEEWIYVARPSTLELLRSRVEGSVVETVLTHQAVQSGPYFVGLDLVNRYAYWGVVTQPDDTNTAYSRGTLDGVVDAGFSLVTPSRTRDIAVDNDYSGGTRLFWCDRQNGAVYWRLVAGGSIGTARTGLNAPHGLFLDLEAGKGYVADTGKAGAVPSRARTGSCDSTSMAAELSSFSRRPARSPSRGTSPSISPPTVMPTGAADILPPMT